MKHQRPMINTSDVRGTESHFIDAHSSIPTDEIEIAVVTNEDINSDSIAKYARDLRFMEEPVTFILANTNNKNDPNPILVGVNGEERVIWRSQVYTLARKFLNTLFETVHEMSTQQYQDQNGVTQTRFVRTVSPAYSVSVMQDTPDGRKWFERIQNLQFR